MASISKKLCRSRSSEEAVLGGFKYTITPNINKASQKSALGQFKEYIGAAEWKGAYRCTDLASKICREGVEIARLAKNHHYATAMQGPGAVFSRVAGGFVIPYAAVTAIEMKEAWDRVDVDGGSNGNIEKLVSSILTFVTTSCYALLQFIPGHTTFKTIATVTDLAGEGMELEEHAAMWSLADNLGKDTKLSSEIQDDLAQMKTQHLLGLVKSVIALVGAIFAFLTMVFAAAVVPPIVSATLALSAVALAIIKDFHALNIEWPLALDREMALVF